MKSLRNGVSIYGRYATGIPVAIFFLNRYRKTIQIPNITFSLQM